MIVYWSLESTSTMELLLLRSIRNQDRFIMDPELGRSFKRMQ